MGAPNERGTALPVLAEGPSVEPSVEEPELDPVEALQCSIGAQAAAPPRTLDFVRVKFRALKAENKALKERVADLETTLSIVQTAQQWSMSNSMTPEQAQKVKEVTSLLQQAKQAKEEAASFSKVGRAELYEKLRTCKDALRREREQNRDMKERLMHAFRHGKTIKEQHHALGAKHAREREGWQALINELRDRHRTEVARFRQNIASGGAGGGGPGGGSAGVDRSLANFSSNVMDDLSELQKHLNSVKEEAAANPMVSEDDEAFRDRLLGQPAAHGANDPISLTDDERPPPIQPAT